MLSEKSSVRKDDSNSEKIRKSGGKLSLAPTFYSSSIVSTKPRDNRKSSRKHNNIQHRSRNSAVSNTSAGFESNPGSGSTTRSNSIDLGNQADIASSVSSASSPGKSKVLQFHSNTTTSTTLNSIEGDG